MAKIAAIKSGGGSSEELVNTTVYYARSKGAGSTQKMTGNDLTLNQTYILHLVEYKIGFTSVYLNFNGLTILETLESTKTDINNGFLWDRKLRVRVDSASWSVSYNNGDYWGVNLDFYS